jgi:plastocyanin
MIRVDPAAAEHQWGSSRKDPVSRGVISGRKGHLAGDRTACDMAQRLLIALTCALALAAVPGASSASATVTITGTGFVPETVTINAGNSVTWRNADTAVHQVVFGQAPCNLTIQPGATASCTFRAGGSFNYRDPSESGAFRGTVTVTGPRRSVTLQSSRRAVIFAGAVTLSGVISSQQAGESVNLFAQECGQTAFMRVGSATTAAGGDWTFAVKPTLKTVYRARWKTTESIDLARVTRFETQTAYWEGVGERCRCDIDVHGAVEIAEGPTVDFAPAGVQVVLKRDRAAWSVEAVHRDTRRAQVLVADDLVPQPDGRVVAADGQAIGTDASGSGPEIELLEREPLQRLPVNVLSDHRLASSRPEWRRA